MSIPAARPANKRFEALRSQIKNTLFEATQNPSPKALPVINSLLFISPNATSLTIPLEKSQSEPIEVKLDSELSDDKGKWRKMTEITKRKNFEMMRSNLKVQMFGKTSEPYSISECSTQGSLDSPANMPIQASFPIPEVVSRESILDRTEKPTQSSSLLKRLDPERLAKLQSLVLPKEIIPNQYRKEDASPPIIVNLTPKSNSVFKMYDAGAEWEQESGSPDQPHIVTLLNNFHEYYEELEILGEGTSGTVKRCRKVGSGEEFAVKIINYRGDDELRTLITNEFKNHRKLHHKNIVQVHDLYVDVLKNKMYTVMELVRCREMFEVISNLGTYSEAVASSIFKQILIAIQYLHSKGVCHRDLKPNNILVSDDGSIVKITDFNVSKFADEGKKKYTSLSKENFKMWTYTGTIAFTAPEVLNDTEYTEMVDMWSAGCVLYTMICGSQPFEAEYLNDLIEKIKEGKVDYSAKVWENISPEVKDLLQKMLNVDPKQRYSPSQALAHPWIVNVGKANKKNITDVVENLRSNVRKNSKTRAEPASATFKPTNLKFGGREKKRRSTFIEQDLTASLSCEKK